MKFYLQSPYFSFFPFLCMYLNLITLWHEFLDNFDNPNKNSNCSIFVAWLDRYFLACSGARGETCFRYAEIKKKITCTFFRKIWKISISVHNDHTMISVRISWCLVHPWTRPGCNFCIYFLFFVLLCQQTHIFNFGWTRPAEKISFWL